MLKTQSKFSTGKRNNVIYFPAKIQSSISVPVLPHTDERGEYSSYTVEGNSLKDFGIFRGDQLISRRISSKKEVFNGALCVVKFGTRLFVMKMKYNRDGSVTFYHSDRQETGKLSAFSVVGIVEAFQRLI